MNDSPSALAPCSWLIDAEGQEESAWTLTSTEGPGPRRLPLLEFLAVFDPLRRRFPDLPLGDAAKSDLSEELSRWDWSVLPVGVWGQIQQLMEDLDEGVWSAFAALGGRWAAERQLRAPAAPVEKPPINPYGAGDLDRGEALIESIFAADGRLASRLGKDFEARDEQLQMALAVWQSLLGGSDLSVEAPTGVGKSLAYLVPAGLFALMKGERVVVSTHTRNLQDQLLGRDLPAVAAADWFPVDAALLKGRENYLCQRRLDRLLLEVSPEREARLAAAALLVWRARTQSGLLDEVADNPLLPRSLFYRLSAGVLGAEESRCAARSDCWVTRARERARKSQLVLVNHSLLLADHAVNRAVLGDYRYLVTDEAQHLAEVATRTLGVELSTRTLDEILQQAAPASGATGWTRRGLANWLPTARHRAAGEPGTELGPLREEVLAGILELRQRFRELLDDMGDLPEVAQVLADAGRLRYGSEPSLAEALMPSASALEGDGSRLASRARELSRILRRSAGADPDDELRLEADQAEALAAGLAELRARLGFLLAGEGDDFVFYLEGGPRGPRALVASPVDVSIELGDYFREGLMASVLTSATLSVQGGFEYFHGKTGLNRSGRESHSLQLSSPFDYEAQVRALLPAYLPEPGRPGHMEAVVRLLAELAAEYPLNTLVLFTSYRALERTRRGLVEMGTDPQRILAQAPDESRDALADRFRRERGLVLLGTSSFWEGVDFPGESLEILVIARLPFAVPSEPLVEARCERIAREGGEPFLEFMVPEAVLRFKQGFGRLVRSRRDGGIVLLLDSRLAHKGYGSRFLSSLPARTRLCFAADSLRQEMHDWYISRPRGKERKA